MIPMVLAVFVLSLSQAPAASQAASPASIVFAFENPQLQPASYKIEIHADGSGRYKSAPGAPATDGIATPDAADQITQRPMEREIRISDGLRSQLFAAAHSHRYFAIACEATKVHVAFTGKKVLTYSGPDGQGSCTYNYSQDEQLNRIADELEAVAFTLEEGERLAVQHEHSRLALDAELETLQEAARAGRALEFGNIAPQLQSIADDEEVMLRARKRARSLIPAADAK